MLRIIAGSLVLALSASAMAETPSYNYGQVVYQRVDLDDDRGFNVDGDGFGIGGSFEIAPNWHIAGGYSSTEFDFGIDLNQLQVGAGFHTDISPTTSFYADLSWVTAEIDTGTFGSIDDDGIGISIGLRSNISPQVELEGSLSYVDLDDSGDNTSIGGAAWYKFSDVFAVGLLANVDEDVVAYGIGGRLYFGN